MSYLSINGVKKSFNNNEVLKNINIDIEQGEFICFLGPSGCGKTTLLRIIAGLESKDCGELNFKGKEISSLPPSMRNVGIVFQNYALFPNLTIFENIAYGLQNKKISKDEIKNKVNEMLTLVGLEESKNKYPSELSGGMQQRVALARAIVLKPDILLLDEPLSALDAKVRESLRSEIRRIQKKLNITTIMVTHDQEEALTMGDKIVVFNKGEVVQIGTPQEVYYTPQSDFAADFIGKINLVSKKDGNVDYLRPECLEFSKESKEGYVETKVCQIEFRGNVYRVLVSLEGIKEQLCIDMSWKENNELNIKEGDTLFLKLQDISGVYKYA